MDLPNLPRFVLANRPGFPFLGNDLLREADAWNEWIIPRYPLVNIQKAIENGHL